MFGKTSAYNVMANELSEETTEIAVRAITATTKTELNKTRRDFLGESFVWRIPRFLRAQRFCSLGKTERTQGSVEVQIWRLKPDSLENGKRDADHCLDPLSVAGVGRGI